MRDQFNVFNANQNIMRRRIDELSEDIRVRLSKVAKQMNNMKNGIMDEPNIAKTAVNAFSTTASAPATPGARNTPAAGRRVAIVSPTMPYASRNSGYGERGRTSSMSETEDKKGKGKGSPSQNTRKLSPNPLQR